jgi:hypothetical protein
MATASAQSRTSRRGRQRADDLKDYWRRSAPPLRFGDDEWRVMVFRGAGQPSLDLSDVVESVSWEDNGPMLTGTMALRLPATHPRLDVGDGHVVRLDHRHQGESRYREVWRMRLGGAPEQSIQVGIKDATYEFPLADDFGLLMASRTSFSVRKDKANPRGVLVHVAIKRLLEKEGIPHASIPTMRHRIKKWSMTSKPIAEILLALVRQENTNEDRDYLVRWRRGRVEIVRKQRSEFLLAMSDTIIEATLTLARKEGFATELRVHSASQRASGRDSHGHPRHAKRKIATTVTRTALVRRYGRIRRTLKVDADSVAEARRKGKRALARLMRPKREVTFTHAGIVSLRRHHALRLRFPDQNINQIVYVRSVSHRVSPGEYSMEVAVRFTDPFAQTKPKHSERACEAARRRHRPLPEGCHERRDHPRPSTDPQRSDGPVPSAPRLTPGEQLSERGLDT